MLQSVGELTAERALRLDRLENGRMFASKVDNQASKQPDCG